MGMEGESQFSYEHRVPNIIQIKGPGGIPIYYLIPDSFQSLLVALHAHLVNKFALFMQAMCQNLDNFPTHKSDWPATTVAD